MEGVSAELADVVKHFGNELLEKQDLSPVQIKALNNIVSCRTALLGWNEYACDKCGTIHYRYNSCGDRHCPKCQATKQALWVDKLLNDTLTVKHYHIVFTAPHCLNDVCLWNDRLYYKLLFRAVWKTLHSFGYTHYGVETGAIAILHSWGENLSLHPHIHCIVPAIGYSLQGKWKHIGKFDNFLYPVMQLSAAFKGAFMDSLKRALRTAGHENAFHEQKEKAYASKWVVHCEPSMADVDHVVRYLGRYTHRIAISNQRIKKISDTEVTFSAKNYKDRARMETITLTGVEFLRRFCLHIMPKGFVRIRRFGIYHHTSQRSLDLSFFSPAQKTAMLIEEKAETKPEKILRITGFDRTRCPCCKSGTLIPVKEQPRIRSPAADLMNVLKAKLL